MRSVRRFPTGVRWQATVAAAAVVAVALLFATLALVALLQHSLTTNLESTLTAVVDEDTRTLRAQGMTALASSEADRGADSILVQVLDDSGAVVYTSEPARTRAQSTLRPQPAETLTSGRRLLPLPWDLAGPLVVAKGVQTSAGSFVVMAATSQRPVEEAVTTTALLLAAGVPLLTALAGMVTWWRVGRTLASVDSIREQVERIEAANLTDRVPVPPTHDEIARLASTMNGMLRRLEVSDRTQRQFFADASHELRSPLATLAASLELAQHDDTGLSWLELAPVLGTETERMARIVDDLLLLSKVDNRALALAADDVDLDDLAQLECRRLQQVSSFRVALNATPVRVRGDGHQLGRLLRNLIDNAAGSARSQVRVTVAREGKAALVRVEDDGPGIKPDDRERVFERFVRLDESRSRRSGGSGLGLAIAREIASAHHARLSVQASALGGAAFELRWPPGR